MWNVETAEPQKPLFADRKEVTQVLKPPPLKPKEENQNHVFSAQMLICVLLIGGILCARSFFPQLYQTFRAGYQQISGQGMTIAGEEELVKFANALIKDVSVQAAQIWDQMADGNSLGYGAGGWTIRTAPQGSSLEKLKPEETLTLPIRGYTITSEYGWRKDPFTGKTDFHTGIDLAVAEGTPIRPALNGIVQKSVWNASYGNYVQILHDDGLVTRYCHMQYIFVRQGQRITTQDVLGTVGQTGAATGPHLHFELFCNDVRYDPTAALEAGV